MVVAKVTTTTIATTLTHRIDHTITRILHHTTVITTLHRAPKEGQVGTEVTVVVVVVVAEDPQVTEVMEPPHHTTIEERAMGLQCHPQPHLKGACMEYRKPLRTTET